MIPNTFRMKAKYNFNLTILKFTLYQLYIQYLSTYRRNAHIKSTQLIIVNRFNVLGSSNKCMNIL